MSTLTCLAAGLAFGGLLGCYTVDFDANQTGAYYCKADADCLPDHACERFRCVADVGPTVVIKEPELLTEIRDGTSSYVVTYDVSDFIVSDSNELVEGQGKLLLSVDGGAIEMVSTNDKGFALDLSAGLAPGAHRLQVQAVFGDGQTPYTNPSATDHTVFYIVEQTSAGLNSPRPQVAIAWPPPNHAHVVDEELAVTVSVREFDIVDNAPDCELKKDCDPWAEVEDGAEVCEPDAECTLSTTGHAHLYLVSNYPNCLTDAPIGCNGDYILTLRPREATDSTDRLINAVIPADRFPKAGSFAFTASLQYNNHIPYPNVAHVIFDQITLNVVD